MGLSVSLFSRAFPWHFILDRSLYLVQLGASLLKLFTPTLRELGRESYKVTEFFEFVRPHLGSEISFGTVFQRLNTPFLFRLVNMGSNNLAEVGSLGLESRQASLDEDIFLLDSKQTMFRILSGFGSLKEREKAFYLLGMLVR